MLLKVTQSLTENETAVPQTETKQSIKDQID